MNLDKKEDEDAETFIAQLYNNTVENFNERLHNNYVQWTRDESFARRLGAALQDNTNIDFLKVTGDLLNRTTLVEPRGSEYCYNPLLDYVRNSAHLQDFSFWFKERYAENA
jgi:preprotein translocase subunit Sec63